MNYSKHVDPIEKTIFQKYLSDNENGEHNLECEICKDDNFKFQKDFDSFKRFSDLFE